MRTRFLPLLALIVLAVAVLPGCNALAGLLRTDTGAAAPTNQATSHGIAAMPGSTIVILGGRQDATGDVGASGATRGSGSAAQSTAVDPAAVADGAAKLLAAFPAGSPAAALARAAAATAKKDPDAAAALLEAAEAEAAKAPPAEKPAAAPEPAVPPTIAPATAPEPGPAPDAPAGPVGALGGETNSGRGIDLSGG